MPIKSKRKTHKRRIGGRSPNIVVRTKGNVLKPYKVDSISKISKGIDRIKTGPVTIIFVYAPWCGHCKEFEPVYNKVVNDPRRSVQAVQLLDTMVGPFNEQLKKNNPNATILQPNGYPATYIANKDASLVKEFNRSKIEDVSNNAGNFALESISKPNMVNEANEVNEVNEVNEANEVNEVNEVNEINKNKINTVKLSYNPETNTIELAKNKIIPKYVGGLFKKLAKSYKQRQYISM